MVFASRAKELGCPQQQAQAACSLAPKQAPLVSLDTAAAH